MSRMHPRIPPSKSLLAGALALATIPLWAGTRMPVDGVAVTVNGDPILLSEIEEYRQAISAQRPSFAAMPAADQRKEVIDRLVDEKVLLAKAKQDTSLKVGDKEIEARAGEMYARVADQQGGEKQLELALRQATGMSLGQFKSRMNDQVRDQMYRQKLQMKFVGDPEPSQLQVRDFFEKFHDSLPVQKDGLRLSHLQWRIRAGAKLDAAVRLRADSIIKRLDKGESFSELAKSLSDDYSGKEGGDIGYTKRGTLDPDYERAAFSLDAGDYTPRPVRTRFGYHVIRVSGKRDNEVRTSHILLKVVPSSEDTVRSAAFLDSLRPTLKTGADFAALARKISDDRKTREMGGDLGWFPRDSLESAYKDAVDSLPEGGVSAPVHIGDSHHLFRVDRRAAERRLSLEEDYALISQYAKELLVSQKIASLVKKWREHVHVENRLARFKLPDNPTAE